MTTDKTRTIEAATGQLDTQTTLQLGPWTVGYLSMKNSEARQLEKLEEEEAGGRFGKLLDFAYPLFCRRYLGDDAPPTQEEFEDETSPIDIRVFLAWLNGVSVEEARTAANPLAQAPATPVQ